MAQASGFPLVIKLVREQSYWSLETWDQLRIPKPCSMVELEFEAPLYVPKDLSNEDLEELRCSIQQRMNRFN